MSQNGVVTPEKLCMADFMKRLTKAYEHGELNRLVVDEVRPCFFLFCSSEYNSCLSRSLGTLHLRMGPRLSSRL